jgi:negative regulator of flagellin synthesis FlgM
MRDKWPQEFFEISGRKELKFWRIAPLRISSGLPRQLGACDVTNKIGTGGIDNRPVQVGSDRAVKRTNDSSDGAVAGAAKPPASTSDTGVRITDSARQLAALEQAISDLPEIDAARVAKARNAIADGTYQVAADRIADKLLHLEKELS